MRTDNSILLSILLTVLFFSCAAQAQQANVPYLNLEAGIAAQTETGVRDLEEGGESGDGEFDPGYRATLSFGYLLRDGAVFAWRTGAAVRMDMHAEIETGVIYNKLDISELTATGAEDLDLYRLPVLLNLGFHVPVGERMDVILGGGAGALFTYGSTERTDLGSGSGTDIGFSWQVFGEFSYDLNDRLSVGAFYKLLGDYEAKLKDDVQVRIDSGFVHTLGVSLRWLL